MKYHATERMRRAINDAMDVHAGKAVIEGPRNYLGNLYRAVPIAITVEGVNILTRNLIIFGQGAIRCHPYLLAEMRALERDDREEGLKAFDEVFWRHTGHGLTTLARAFGRSWTGGAFAPAPDAGAARPYYKQLARYAAGFALASEMALLTLGAALKRREMLSARLGDILSELYLMSAALKRWEDEGREEADLPILEWCMAEGFKTIGIRFEEVFANLPNQVAAWLLRFLIQPFGPRRHQPADALSRRCAALLLEPSDMRDRLTAGLFLGCDDDGLARLERAFSAVVEADPVSNKLRQAHIRDLRMALDNRVITEAEASAWPLCASPSAAVVDVDDFPPTLSCAQTGTREIVAWIVDGAPGS